MYRMIQIIFLFLFQPSASQAIVTASSIGPDEVPPPYQQEQQSSVIVTCRVCQALIDISWKKEQHVVKCSQCHEATVRIPSSFVFILFWIYGTIIYSDTRNIVFLILRLFYSSALQFGAYQRNQQRLFAQTHLRLLRSYISVDRLLSILHLSARIAKTRRYHLLVCINECESKFQ